MNLVSKTALAAALTIGVAGTISIDPALAAADRPAGTTIALPATLRNAMVSARAALTAKNYAAAETSVAAVEAAATTDTERYFGQSLRLALESGKAQGQPEARRAMLLLPVIEALIANPATPRDEVGLRLNERGNLLFATKKYAAARQSFTAARDGGYSDEELLPNIARSRVASGDVVGGMTDLEALVTTEKAAGRKVPEDVYTYAIAHLYTAKAYDQVAHWTRLWLTDYGTALNWRSAVYTLGLTGPNAANFAKRQIDLYRLLQATKSLAGERDYLAYATVAANAGAPEEARAVLREGLDSGAIPTGSASAAAIQKTIAGKAKGAVTPEAREKRAVAGGGADLAQAAGDTYLGTRNYPKAAAMYQLAAQRRIGDTDRNALHLGMALALSGDRAGAATAFASVTGEPHRSIAGLWTTYLVAAPAG